MDLVYIGKLVNTHGLKGEVKIISDFEYKSDVFNTDNSIYIKEKKYIIKSYRKHKNYDMVILDGIDNIDLALNLKGENVYINRSDYKFNGYLNVDLIGLEVYDNNTYKGKVIDIEKGSKYDLLIIDGIKKHLVPNISEFIKEIDLKNNKIYIKYIKGLDLEN